MTQKHHQHGDVCAQRCIEVVKTYFCLKGNKTLKNVAEIIKIMDMWQ